jgi:transcriptional regulator with XRE-family HTH domain
MQTIRELRVARGWSQLALANQIGVTPGTVYNWERGKGQMSAAMLRRLAEAFTVQMEDIALPGEDSGPDAKRAA